MPGSTQPAPRSTASCASGHRGWGSHAPDAGASAVSQSQRRSSAWRDGQVTTRVVSATGSTATSAPGTAASPILHQVGVGFDATTPPMSWTRQQRAELASTLHPQLATAEIARRLGVARSTVRAYLNDPDGSGARARALARQGGRCRSCGQLTGAARGSRTFELCPGCAGASRASWSREQVLDAYAAWCSWFGSAPTSTDWNRTHATRRGGRALERFRSGRWPTTTVIKRLFGGWPGLAAAAHTSPADERA